MSASQQSLQNQLLQIKTQDIPLSKILSTEMVCKVEEGTSERVDFLKLNTSETDIYITAEKDAKFVFDVC